MPQIWRLHAKSPRQSEQDPSTFCIENDLVGGAVMALMDQLERQHEERWEGNCKELLVRLGETVGEGAQKSADWPKTPKKLSDQLKRLTTFLRASGLEVKPPNPGVRGTKGKRVWTLTRITGRSTGTTGTTVTHAQAALKSPSVTEIPGSDGQNPAVTDEPSPEDQPSPASLACKPLNGNGYGSGVKEVTVVPVDQSK